jgi:CBS domain-containing protein
MDNDANVPETSVEDVLSTKGTLHDSPNVLTAAPHDSVYDCIDRMVAREIGSIVVMEDDDIAGIFTERDYMRKVELEGRRSEDTAVQAVMTEEVVTVGPNRSLDDCLDRMRDLQCRHLPVLNDAGQLIDIISMRDCMRQLSDAAKSKALQLIEHMRDKYPVQRHG